MTILLKNGLFSMKKSYTLIITTILITLFSYISILILQTKSLKSTNLQNQYLYIQGKNHMSFFKDLIISTDLENINHLEIENKLFDIYAIIKEENSAKKIDIFVKAKNYNISIYESLLKE